MGLFSDPVSITTTAGTQTFVNGGQVLNAKSKIGEWLESTTGIDLAAESKVVAKHTETGTLNRRLLQRTVLLDPLSGETERRRVTINKTYTYDDNVTEAELVAEDEVLTQLEADTGFFSRFVMGLI